MDLISFHYPFPKETEVPSPSILQTASTPHLWDRGLLVSPWLPFQKLSNQERDKCLVHKTHQWSLLRQQELSKYLSIETRKHKWQDPVFHQKDVLSSAGKATMGRWSTKHPHLLPARNSSAHSY